MDVLANLRAGAHGGPGVDHGALVNIRADVHVTWHQDDIACQETAAACNRRGNHADAKCLHLFKAHPLELGGNLVEELKITGLDSAVVCEAKTQQDSLLDPLMDLPACGCLVGDP